MQSDRFEQALAHHCAPTFCFLKPASLLCFPRLAGLPALLQRYRAAFAPYGVALELVRGGAAGWLVLVYRPDLLERQLSQPAVGALLARAGYPSGGLAAQLAYLKRRLQTGDGFPHEIGLFLGYPTADVCAFQKYKGAGCKLCGYWKVYTDVEQAKRSFAAFDACRAAFEGALRAGNTVTQLLAMQPMRTA